MIMNVVTRSLKTNALFVLVLFLFSSFVFFHLPNSQAISLQDAVKEALVHNDQLKIAKIELKKIKNDYNASMVNWLPKLNVQANYQLKKEKQTILGQDTLPWIRRVRTLTSWIDANAPSLITRLSYVQDENAENILQAIGQFQPLLAGLAESGGDILKNLRFLYRNMYPDDKTVEDWDIGDKKFTDKDFCFIKPVEIGFFGFGKETYCALNIENVRDVFNSLFHQEFLKDTLSSLNALHNTIGNQDIRQPIKLAYDAAKTLLALNTPEDVQSLIASTKTIVKSIDGYLQGLQAASEVDIIRTTVSLNWNLFKGGQDVVDLQSRRLEYKQQSIKTDKAVNQVIYDTVEAYSNLYFIKINLTMVKENLDLARRLFSSMTARFENGLISSLDLTGAEIMVMTIEKLHNDLQSQLQLAESRYVNVVGTLHEDLEEPSIPIVPQLDDVKSLQKLSDNHPDLMLARYDILRARNNSYAGVAKLLPVIDMNISYNRDMQLYNFKKVRDNWSGDINIHLNVFNAGQDIINIYNTNLDNRIAFLKLQQSYRDVNIDVMDSMFEVEKLRLELDFQNINIDHINRKLRKVEIELDRGVSSIEDLVKAFSDLFKAVSSRIDTKRLLVLKSYKLLQDMGTLSLQDLV